MERAIRALALSLVLLPALATAQGVIVTRNFTGVWDQPAHESQGITLQIIDQSSGSKVGVVYWFTYGDDMQSAWFLGTGPVAENRIDMTLYQGSGIGFLEGEKSGNNRVTAVGTMTIEFSSCDEGIVTFTTGIAQVGSGSFNITRLSDLFNTQCSGGVSDDTPADVLTTEQRIMLVPARQSITGSGHADFRERADRTEFSVEVSDVADGTYRIFVGGVERADLDVNAGFGETEFRSPTEAGKILLTFDPRGESIEVHDAQGAVFSSGTAIIDGGTGGEGISTDFGTTDIRADLSNTGVYPAASGRARLEPREDRTDFSVEIEDVPEGSYPVSIAGMQVGILPAAPRLDGTVGGELEFRDPVEPGKILLDFDPRGEDIEVLDGSTVILATEFPMN